VRGSSKKFQTQTKIAEENQQTKRRTRSSKKWTSFSELVGDFCS
jgi:hypothetical protein